MVQSAAEEPGAAVEPNPKSGSNEVEEYVEEIDAGDASEEAVQAKVKWAPHQPTRQEIEDHEARWHLPPRTWCASCVVGRCISDQHRTSDQLDWETRLPGIHIDYFFMGQKEEDVLPMLAVRLKPTRVLAGTTVSAKSDVRDAVEFLKAVIFRSGCKRLLFKSDNEPAILKLKERVMQEMPMIEVVPEQSPVGDHEANCIAERAVQELEKQIRVVKSDMDAKFKMKLPGDHPLVAWIASFA